MLINNLAVNIVSLRPVKTTDIAFEAVDHNRKAMQSCHSFRPLLIDMEFALRCQEVSGEGQVPERAGASASLETLRTECNGSRMSLIIRLRNKRSCISDLTETGVARLVITLIIS
jgi:hypothetical protein